MRAMLIFGILTCLLTLQAASAAEMWLGPMEKLCRDHDLVVVVKFLDATEVPAKEVEALDKLIYPSGYVRKDIVLKRCRFKIVEVLRNNTEEKLGDTLTAVANFDPPRDPEEPRVRCSPRRVVDFSQDSNEVLIISRLAEDKDYYVSTHTQLSMTAYPETVEEVRMAANPEKWDWSKPVNGLSIAVNVWNEQYGGRATWARAVLALRNQTKRTIEFSITDGAAKLELRGPSGRLVEKDA